MYCNVVMLNRILALSLIEEEELGINPWQKVGLTSRQRPQSHRVPRATSCEGTAQTTESAGGQFPSHPGRPGPETSSEGTHLTPNPQEIRAGFSLSHRQQQQHNEHFKPPLHPVPPNCCTVPPSLPHFSSSEAPKPRKLKASVRARANPRAAFPRARADEILFFARKNYRGREEEKTKNKVKQTVRGRWRTGGVMSWSSEIPLPCS